MLLSLSLLLICATPTLSKVVIKDGKKYLDRMNWEILNDGVLEHRMKESRLSYILFMDPSDDSRRFKNLFDVMSMDIMDEVPEVSFFIVNVHANPKCLEMLGIPSSDVPTFRFYSYMNELPYTDHFWNRFRMADYVRERAKNTVKALESKDEVGRVLHYADSFIYFHDDSVPDHENELLHNLEAMASLYHKLNVYLVKDEALFHHVKTLAPLNTMSSLKNKSHLLIYHSSHTGINVHGFNNTDMTFLQLREFYRKHRFGLILDYSRDVHDFLFVENIPAMFLVVKELHVRNRQKALDWGNVVFFKLIFQRICRVSRKTSDTLKWTTTNTAFRRTRCR